MAVTYTKDILKDYIEVYGYEIGSFTYGSVNVLTWGEGRKLRIGKYCSIAGNLTVFLGGNHRYDWVTTYPFSAITDSWPEAAGITGHPQSNGDVNIGNDVWLGANCTILSGVTIGDGAVVAASSIVTKDVRPYSIVGGNPAKLIRNRFDEITTETLMKLRWWDFGEDKIRKLIPYLLSSNIKDFILEASKTDV
jgi:acetyltransferase-like isoleucine patch superfamily enzyme